LTETDDDGNTSLLFAAWGGHLELMHFLIEHNASLHEQNNNGHSVLLSAANGGRINVVEWLITQGFSLAETNNNGDTALLLAAYGGHRPLVEWLLARGASLDDRNGCGFTPLLSAANGGQLEMAAWLLKNGSTMTEADNDGYTSLILGACGGNIELVNFFLENGAHLSERNHNGDTALLLAAYCGHHDLVEWLLDNGSSLGERNNTGMGVLISAANGGNLEVVQLLLRRISEAEGTGDDCGDGLEHTDEGGYTPFLLAAQRGHLNVVQFLAAYGANIQARTSRHDNNAIALATDFPDVQKYVQEAWAWSPLAAAVDARMTDRVHAMIQAGVEGPVVQAARKIADNTSAYPNALPTSREISALLAAAVLPWSTSRGELFSAGFGVTVKATLDLRRALLLEENREDGKPILPLEIWLLIVSQFQRSWFTAKSTEQLQVGWIEPSSERTRLRWRQRHLLNQSVELDAEELYHSGVDSGDETTVFAEEVGGDELLSSNRAVVGAGARVGGAASPAVAGGANGGGAAAGQAIAQAQAAAAAAAVAQAVADQEEDEEDDQAAAEGSRSSRARNSTSEHSAALGFVPKAATAAAAFAAMTTTAEAGDTNSMQLDGDTVGQILDAKTSLLPSGAGAGAVMGKVATVAEDVAEDGQLGLPYRVSWI
jgi:ankyrin repeat protein